MKRYLDILKTLFVGCLFFSLASCAKKEAPATLFSDMLGSWTKTAYATDDNGSGVITSSEIFPVTPGTLDLVVFKADTTGYEKTSSSPDTLRFTWYVNGENVTIDYTDHDTTTYFVENVNSVNLTLYENTRNGLVAYYYNK